MAFTGLLSASEVDSQPATPIKSIGAQATSSMPAMTSLVAPIVMESTEWNSVLTLVNESTTIVHAQISLRTTNDLMSTPSKIVILQGHSSQRLMVAGLFSEVAPDFLGSLTVSIQEPEAAMNMAVATQITLVGQGSLAGVSIDEELQMPQMQAI